MTGNSSRTQAEGRTEPDCLILGAGSLGRLWGGLMPPGDVAFIPRNLQVPGMNCEYQLQSVTAPSRRVSIPWRVPSLSRVSSVVLVTTKAQDTVSALQAIRSLLPQGTPLVLFQNGLGSQEAVVTAFPDHPILAASTTEGANRPNSDTLVHAAAGTTWIGALNDQGERSLTRVASTLAQSGLDIEIEHNILQRLWNKLVINAGINPFTALLDCSNGDILKAALYQDNIDGVCHELAALMRHEGLIANAKAMRNSIEQLARATARNTSSMRADVVNHRPTEIDFINGYIARRCDALDLPATVNQQLTNRVKALSTQQ